MSGERRKPKPPPVHVLALLHKHQARHAARPQVIPDATLFARLKLRRGK